VKPNLLEASFKSNKCESTGEDVSSALEMNLAALTLKWHLNLALTQVLVQINSRISSRKDLGSGMSVFGGVLACGVSNK
jgi:hypothetical protein